VQARENGEAVGRSSLNPAVSQPTHRANLTISASFFRAITCWARKAEKGRVERIGNNGEAENKKEIQLEREKRAWTGKRSQRPQL